MGKLATAQRENRQMFTKQEQYRLAIKQQRLSSSQLEEANEKLSREVASLKRQLEGHRGSGQFGASELASVGGSPWVPSASMRQLQPADNPQRWAYESNRLNQQWSHTPNSLPRPHSATHSPQISPAPSMHNQNSFESELQQFQQSISSWKTTAASKIG